MVFIGADHRGYRLKEKIKEKMREKGITFEDEGAREYDENDDYPEVAISLAEKVLKEKGKGILLCGSGVGVCVAANKVKGVRAGVGFEGRQTRKAVEDDDMNILCLAADSLDEDQAWELVEQFLNSQFVVEDRHLKRIKMIADYEKCC